MLPKIFRASDDTAGMADMDVDISDQVFIIADGDVLQLPEGFDAAMASYTRAGPDLLLTGADGSEVVVADFFMSETPLPLVGADGSRVSGALAVRLAGAQAPGQGAGEAQPSEAIGRISSLTGEVTVIHADGTHVTVHAGDSLFLGDILETGTEAGAGILLADGTALSMAADGRMVLDEMVYDPGVQEGSLSLSVLSGVFTIVSGEIAKTSVDAMQITTPTATISIRGTQVGLDLTGENGMTVVMMEEADGFVGEVSVTNDGGVMTLNQAYLALTVHSFQVTPIAVQTFAHDMLLHTFGVTFAFLPVEGTNANDYGLQASLAEGLAGFDALSGVEEATFNTSAGDVQALDTPVVDARGDGAGDTISPLAGIAGFDAVATDVLPGIDAGASGVSTFTTDAGTAAAPADVVFGAEVAPMAVMEDIVAVALGEVNVTGPALQPIPAPSTAASPSTAAPVTEPLPAPVNTPPMAEPGTVLTAEDNIFSGQLAATDREGDTLTFDVAAGGKPAHGSVAISPDGTFSYIPDPDFGGEDAFTYQVTDEAGGVSTATLSVTVTQVVDVPVLAVASAVGREDAGVTLAIAAAMPAGTTETITSIAVSGVPLGAVLSAGSDNGDGTWDVALDQLSGLVLTPPADFSGSFDVRVTALSSDGGQATTDLSVTVAAVADAPTLTVSDVVVQVDAQPNEDGENTHSNDAPGDGNDHSGEEADDDHYVDEQDDDAVPDGAHADGDSTVVALDISAALTDIDGSEALSIEITGVPTDAVLNVGADHGDGIWTLTGEDLQSLGSLSLTMPEDEGNEGFALTVTATSTEHDTGEMATASGVIDVSFERPNAALGEQADQRSDTLHGGDGADVLNGDKSDDALYGGAGNDHLDGGKGRDLIDGGAGDDVLVGGKGEDTFVFRAGDGTDIVLDLGKHDELRFEGPEFSAEDITLQTNGEEQTTITFGEGAGVSVTLNDIFLDANGAGYSVTQDGDAVVVALRPDNLGGDS